MREIESRSEKFSRIVENAKEKKIPSIEIAGMYSSEIKRLCRSFPIDIITMQPGAEKNLYNVTFRL